MYSVVTLSISGVETWKMVFTVGMPLDAMVVTISVDVVVMVPVHGVYSVVAV